MTERKTEVGYRVAIASGKGGTGKTTVSVNLAAAASEPIWLLDCDVEEPNGHVFLKPRWEREEKVTVLSPVVDAVKCSHCGQCGSVCQYNAIVSLKTVPLVYPTLCHGCGGCALVCPTGAIREEPREVGVVKLGKSGMIHFGHGLMAIGEAMAVPVIRALKRVHRETRWTLLDSPPGTACPVVTTTSDADYVVLVTEPTPFGLHDLTLAVALMREMNKRFGVVVNRVGMGDDRVQAYCKEEGIAILAELPDDRRVAEACSRGELPVDVLGEFRGYFERLWKTLTDCIEEGGA